jgi:hypothetical protein
MSEALKPGDRVRVTLRNRVRGYTFGDKGTVRRGPRKSPISGVVYHVVSMDKDAHAWNVVFNADEITPIM